MKMNNEGSGQRVAPNYLINLIDSRIRYSIEASKVGQQPLQTTLKLAFVDYHQRTACEI